MKRILLMTVFLLGMGPLDAKTPLEPESYQLDQCAIVQVGNHPRVYLTAPTGEVEAVEVATGKVLWHTNKASFAFLVRGSRLLAYSPAVAKGETGCRVEILDARSGNVIKKFSDPPTGPIGCVGEGINASLHIQGFTQDGRDCLVWTSKWWSTPGGRNKGPNYVYPPGSSGTTQGGFEVDVLKGKLAPLGGVIPQTELRSQTNSWGGSYYEPFKVEGVTAQPGIEIVEHRGAQLILRRWKGTESLPEIRMASTPFGSYNVVICGDRRNVLGIYELPTLSQVKLYHLEEWAAEESKKHPLPDKDEVFLYRMTIYSSVTGEKMGEVDATAFATTAQVCGDFLVYYSPGYLHVMSISSGKEIWMKPVKDLTYRGPYPPSRRL